MLAIHCDMKSGGASAHTSKTSTGRDSESESDSEGDDDKFPLLELPTQTMNTVIAFVSRLKKAPFPKGLILTCKKLTRMVYKHPQIAYRFHVRVDPMEERKWPRRQLLKIGLPISEAAMRSVVIGGGKRMRKFALQIETEKRIIDSIHTHSEDAEDVKDESATVEDISSATIPPTKMPTALSSASDSGLGVVDKKRKTQKSAIGGVHKSDTFDSLDIPMRFPLEGMRVWKVMRQCTAAIAQPVFDYMKTHASVKFLSFVDCAFLNGDRVLRVEGRDDGGSAAGRALMRRAAAVMAPAIGAVLRQKSLQIAEAKAAADLKRKEEEETEEKGSAEIMSSKKAVVKATASDSSDTIMHYASDSEDSEDGEYFAEYCSQEFADSYDIPVFDSVLLFSVLLKRTLLPSISFAKKFPSLVHLALDFESSEPGDLEKIQQLLSENGDQLCILQLGFNLVGKKECDYGLLEEKKFVALKMPPSLEILSVSVISCDMIRLDLSECRHSLRQLVCVENALSTVRHIFDDNLGAKRLQYVVINDVNDLHRLPWTRLIEYGICQVYTPSLKSFAEGISGDNITCIPKWPYINAVRDSLRSEVGAKLLRASNCEEGRFRLFGLFWAESGELGESERYELIKAQKELDDKGADFLY